MLATRWVDVPGFEEFYKVSDSGQVWSKRRQRTLSPSRSKWGHLRVNLHGSQPGSPRTFLVHRLVKESFDGPAPKGLVVCHRNGVPDDNRLDNLRFGTQTSNMLDKQDHGTDHQRSKTHCPRGHELREPNLQASKWREGRRACRACHQARSDLHNGAEGTMQEVSDRRYRRIVEGR